MYVQLKYVRVYIDISASERENGLLHLLSLEFRVLYFSPKDRELRFTGTIEHRFSNSVNQSGRAQYLSYFIILDSLRPVALYNALFFVGHVS